MLTVPATYGSSFSAPFRYEFAFDGSALGADSILIISNGVANGDIDAFGDITVPAGTFPTLRQRTVTTSIDSVFVKAFGTFFLVNEQRDTSISYAWWGQNGLGTICSINVETDETPISSQGLIRWSLLPLRGGVWCRHLVLSSSVTW